MKGIIKATGEEAEFQRITIMSDPVFEPQLPPGTLITYYSATIDGIIGVIFNEEQVTITEE